MSTYNLMIDVKWSDLDANQHVKSAAYSDFSKHVWLTYFKERGFTQAQVREFNIGPITMKEEFSYFHEVRDTEPIEVRFSLIYLSRTGIKWTAKFDFYRKDGTKTTTHILYGAWMNLVTRELAQPPDIAVDILKTMPLIKNA